MPWYIYSDFQLLFHLVWLNYKEKKGGSRNLGMSAKEQKLP